MMKAAMFDNFEKKWNLKNKWAKRKRKIGFGRKKWEVTYIERNGMNQNKENKNKNIDYNLWFAEEFCERWVLKFWC